MPISIVGDGSITGLTAGGLPDASVVDLDLATGISSSKLTGALPALDGSSLTGVGVTGIVSSANATAITINSSEQVGIGNTSPASLLDIKSVTDGTMINLTRHNVGEWKIDLSNTPVDSSLPSGTLSFVNQNGSSFAVYKNATTKSLEITNDGRGLSQFTAKAWFRLQGNGTILDSHNISSITNQSQAGWHTPNFANALASANYAVVASDEGYGMSSTYYGHTTSKFDLYTYNASHNTYDVGVECVVFGD
jgi:hypothetical protein